MAAVARLCVQYNPKIRPDMSVVVEALTPLVRPLASTSSNLSSAAGASGV
jgi:hypothetical protein